MTKRWWLLEWGRKTLRHYLSMTSSSFSCTTFTFQNGVEECGVRRERRGHTCEASWSWSSDWLEGILRLWFGFGSSFVTWAIFNWGEWRQVQSSVLYGCTLAPVPEKLNRTAEAITALFLYVSLSLCLFLPLSCCPSVLLCCFLRQSLIRGSHLVFNKCSVFMLTIGMGRKEGRGSREQEAGSRVG